MDENERYQRARFKRRLAGHTAFLRATRPQYHTCPECDANFVAVEGKFPPHGAFKDHSKPCPGSGQAVD
jgi:hypothetical protein